MKTRTRTLWGGVASCMLALALAASLVPADAVAFATGQGIQNQGSAQVQQEDDQSAATNASSSTEIQNSSTDGDASQATADNDRADVSLSGGASSEDVPTTALPSPSDAADSDEDINMDASTPLTELAVEGDLQVDESVLSVPVPTTVHTVDPLYFWQFPNAKSIVVAEGNPWLASYKGLLYTADLKTLLAAPLAIGTEVTLAPECESIAEGALRGVDGIERIVATSMVTSIFMSADDDGTAGGVYLNMNLQEVHLSAFSAQTVQRAIVTVEVDADDTIEATAAWRMAGFLNIEAPEEATEEDDGVLEGESVADPDADQMGGADNASSADDDASQSTDVSNKTDTPESPKAMEAEKPLENTPQPESRPQTITGEYYVLGTTQDNEPEPDRVITSNDVLTFEANVLDSSKSEEAAAAEQAPMEDVQDPDALPGETTDLPETEQPKDETDQAEDLETTKPADEADDVYTLVPDQSSTKLATVTATIAEEIVTFAASAAGTSRATNDQLNTTLNPNGGTIYTFYVEGARSSSDDGWSSRYAIPGSQKTQGTGPYNFDHRGASNQHMGANASNNGYFHTLKRNSTYQAAGYEGVKTLEGHVYYRYNVQCFRAGYDFVKWTEGKAGGASWNGNGAIEAAGKTLYANWSPRTYTITYKCENGAGDFTADATFDKALPTITAPGWVGRTFKGFYTEPGGKGVRYYNENAAAVVGSYTTAGNLTLYAHWELIPYTLTFNPTGGTMVDSNGHETAGTLTQTYTINGATFYDFPTRDGYDFAGWMITGDAVANGIYFVIDGVLTDKQYVAGKPVRFSSFGSGIYGNATLTALWTSTVYLYNNNPPSGVHSWAKSIYYYPGYGYNAQYLSGYEIYESTTMVTAANFTTSALVAPPALDGNGYRFLGYYTEEKDGTQRLTASGTLSSFVAVDGETRWYTQWEVVEYTITLDPAGGWFSDNTTAAKEITYKKGVAGDLIGSAKSTDKIGLTPRSSNKEFIGWKAVDCPSTITSLRPASGVPYESMYLSSVDYGDITLQAVWRVKITLNGNAPQQPQESTVSQARSSLFYYTSYGYSFNPYESGASQFANASNFSKKGDALFAASSTFTVPTCTDAGWIYSGYSSSKTAQADRVSATGVLQQAEVSGNTTWYAVWTPRTYTATLDAGPGTQEGTQTVSFSYGDTRLAGIDAPASIPAPTFSGWTFGGYCFGGVNYVESTGRHPVTGVDRLFSVDQPDHPLLGDCTLRATWVRDIPVDASGGEPASSTYVRATYGEPLPASAADQLPTTPTAAPSGVTWKLTGLYGSKTTVLATQFYEGDGSREYDTIITDLTPSTLYARWQRDIEVDANEGEGDTRFSILKGLTTPRVPAVDMPAIKREGYSLKGFYSAKVRGDIYFDESGEPTARCSSVTVPSTVYAQWVANESIIMFDATGGTGGPARIVGETDRPIADTALPTKQPTKDNYRFIGWFTACQDDETAQAVTQLPDAFPAGGVTYYAHWELKPTASITFVAEEGGLVRLEDGREGASITEGGIMPDTGFAPLASAVPEIGYQFAGWFATDGTQVSSSQIGWQPLKPVGGWPASTVYTARFELSGYGITYRCDICGELSRSDDPTCRHIQSIHALPGGFGLADVQDGPVAVGVPEMRVGYAFVGWSGTGLEGAENESIQLGKADLGDKVFTAHVRAVEYTLTLDAAGGTWTNLSVQSGYTVAGERASRAYTADTDSFQLPRPQREGYLFDHWERSGAPMEGDTFMPGVNGLGDVTLVAAWVPKSPDAYSITYLLADDLGSGRFEEGIHPAYTYTADDEVALPIPVRIGYDFVGWTEESVGLPADQLIIKGDTPVPMAFISAEHMGDRIFRAHWLAHEYTVEYDLAGGAWEGAQPDRMQTVLYDADLTTAKAPTRASYAFDHWEMTGSTARDGQYGAAQLLARANLIMVQGAASEGGERTNMGTVCLTAVWTPRISFDVGVAAEGVHMGLKLAANDGANPFSTNDPENWGTATLSNRTDAALKVTSVMPSSSADYGQLRQNALNLFRTDEHMRQASFTVRPAKGAVLLMNIAKFGIASTEGGVQLPDQYDLPYAYGWMMQAQGAAADADQLKLYYQLDMGALTPEEVNLSNNASLHVANVRFTVALVDEEPKEA